MHSDAFLVNKMGSMRIGADPEGMARRRELGKRVRPRHRYAEGIEVWDVILAPHALWAPQRGLG